MISGQPVIKLLKKERILPVDRKNLGFSLISRITGASRLS